MKSLQASVLLLVTVAYAEVTSFPVIPSATDPEIKQFDDAHWVYLNRERILESQAGRQELLLWLTGTGGNGHGAQGLANLAADLGYHVVSLMYPNDIPATACANDSDPNAFEAFRLALIKGGRAPYQNGRKELLISRADSIENRLIKLLQQLQKKRPKENWTQFLNPDGSIKWESIAIAGQSQGGGHAALMAIKHRVARVLCFGAPKDYSKRHDAPAAWYGLESATPKQQFFAFNHLQDPKGCTPEQQLLNLQALGLAAFGEPAEVDSENPPFRKARILYTRFPQVTVTDVFSDGATTAHVSAIHTKNAARWKSVWTYMLTD